MSRAKDRYECKGCGHRYIARRTPTYEAHETEPDRYTGRIIGYQAGGACPRCGSEYVRWIERNVP